MDDFGSYNPFDVLEWPTGLEGQPAGHVEDNLGGLPGPRALHPSRDAQAQPSLSSNDYNTFLDSVCNHAGRDESSNLDIPAPDSKDFNHMDKVRSRTGPDMVHEPSEDAPLAETRDPDVIVRTPGSVGPTHFARAKHPRQVPHNAEPHTYNFAQGFLTGLRNNDPTDGASPPSLAPQAGLPCQSQTVPVIIAASSKRASSDGCGNADMWCARLSQVLSTAGTAAPFAAPLAGLPPASSYFAVLTELAQPTQHGSPQLLPTRPAPYNRAPVVQMGTDYSAPPYPSFALQATAPITVARESANTQGRLSMWPDVTPEPQLPITAAPGSLYAPFQEHRAETDGRMVEGEQAHKSPRPTDPFKTPSYRQIITDTAPQPRSYADSLHSAVSAKTNLPHCDIGAIELLAFFPNHTQWPEAGLRLTRNGWLDRDVAEGQLRARGKLTKRACGQRMAALRHQVVTNGKSVYGDDGFTRTSYKALWTPVRCYNTAAYQPRGASARQTADAKLVDVANGVVEWPCGEDRGIVTQVIEHAVAERMREVTTADIPNVAARLGFVMPAEASGQDWDQRALGRLRATIREAGKYS